MSSPQIIEDNINYTFEIIIRVETSVNRDIMVEVSDIHTEFFTMRSRDALIDVVEGIRGIGESIKDELFSIAHITCSSKVRRRDHTHEAYGRGSGFPYQSSDW